MVQMYLIHVSVDLGEISEQYHAQHIEFLNQQFDNKVFLTFGRNKTKNSADEVIFVLQELLENNTILVKPNNKYTLRY